MTFPGPFSGYNGHVEVFDGARAHAASASLSSTRKTWSSSRKEALVKKTGIASIPVEEERKVLDKTATIGMYVVEEPWGMPGRRDMSGYHVMVVRESRLLSSR